MPKVRGKDGKYTENISEEQAKILYDKAVNGISLVKLGKELGFSDAYLSKRFRDLGWDLTGDRNRSYNKVGQELWKRHLRREMSVANLAKSVGRSEYWLRHLWRRMGLKNPNPPGMSEQDVEDYTAAFHRYVKNVAIQLPVVAGELGCHLTTLKKRWYDLGFKPRQARLDYARDVANKTFTRDLSGLTLREYSKKVAKEHGTTYTTLEKFWVEGDNFIHEPISPNKIRELFDRRYMNNERTEDLAAEVNLQHHSLRQAWRRLGLDPAKARWEADQRKKYPYFRRAWAMHVDGYTWQQIYDHVGHHISKCPVSFRASVVAWYKKEIDNRDPELPDSSLP